MGWFCKVCCCLPCRVECPNYSTPENTALVKEQDEKYRASLCNDPSDGLNCSRLKGHEGAHECVVTHRWGKV